MTVRRTALILLTVAGTLSGCGIQGPPVPPEDVGVAGVLQRQKELKAKEEAARRIEEKSREPREGESPPIAVPLEDVAQPAARPSGDVQLKPR